LPFDLATPEAQPVVVTKCKSIITKARTKVHNMQMRLESHLEGDVAQFALTPDLLHEGETLGKELRGLLVNHPLVVVWLQFEILHEKIHRVLSTLRGHRWVKGRCGHSLADCIVCTSPGQIHKSLISICCSSCGALFLLFVVFSTAADAEVLDGGWLDWFGKRSVLPRGGRSTKL
jgi:hypothetical protein